MKPNPKESKNNYAVGVHNAKRDYEIITTLTYKPVDGGKGYIVKIKKKKE